MEICIFGDSIVWGAYDPIGGGWVARLKKDLASTDKNITLTNHGVCGENTISLLKHFTNKMSCRQPQLVIIAIGANDPSSKEKFRLNIQNLISHAKSITPRLIFLELVSINRRRNIAKIFFGIKKVLDERNDILQDLCKKNNIALITLSHLLTKKDFLDGLHPNSRGHKKIFEEVKKQLTPLLNQ